MCVSVSVSSQVSALEMCHSHTLSQDSNIVTGTVNVSGTRRLKLRQ